MKTTLKKLGLLAILTQLTFASYAQESASSLSSTSPEATPIQALDLTGKDVAAFDTLSEEQLQALVNILDATPIIPPADLPQNGTFRSLREPLWPPFPGDLKGVGAWELTDGSYLLDDATTSAATTQATTVTSSGSITLSAMDSSGPPSPGGTNDVSTNSYTPHLTGTGVNYGTNLFLANASVTNGWLAALASNTVPGVSYTIQWTTNLLAPQNWQNDGTIVGSALTNWTAWSLPKGNWTNLFLRLRSENSSDGTGLPDWWEALYFGTNAVNPDALDSAGDGWTIYQKYQMGLNPNVFSTPPAPRGVTVNYNANNGTATITWSASQGNLANYTVEKTYTPTSLTPQTNDFSANTTTLTVNVASDQPNPYYNGNIETAFKVRANYSSGNSSWSASLPLQAPTFEATLGAGEQGTPTLVVSAMPVNTTSIKLTELNDDAIAQQNFTAAFVTNFSVPISGFANNMGALPNLQTGGGPDCRWVAQALCANGNQSANVQVARVFANDDGSATNWIAAPFIDGRIQLKENLIFQLRIANTIVPLEFFTATNTPTGESPLIYVLPPPNYVYAAFYDVNNFNGMYGVASNTPYLNIFRPFEDNELYCNFVYNPTNADSFGNLTTGVAYWANSSYDDTRYFALQPPLTYQPTANVNGNSPLLQTNLPFLSTTYQYDTNLFTEGCLVTDEGSYYNLYFSNNIANYWGLPLVAMLASYDAPSGGFQQSILTPGSSVNDGSYNLYNVYSEAAQPIFQTKEYDFWAYSSSSSPQSPLPGSTAFSPTNRSQILIAGVGDTGLQIAAYAKLAVANSIYANGNYPVYGYLGQYFTNAYAIDTNGNVTANPTGVLSPYGNFLATQPGPAALLTMPDVDTGAQGTCTVYCVSLQLDANHDGTMDTALNGTDATSTNSPYVFWANNNFDRLTLDTDDQVSYDDDVQSGGDFFTPNSPVPDCNYKDQYGNRMIPCARDLEDFARLWICGVNSTLISNLPANSTISLSWGDVGAPNPSNPTIDIFTAVETNGGIGYLTNATIADQQANPFYASCVGRVGPGQSLQLYPQLPYGGNNWQGSHYIWCGVSNGTGGLILTLADGSGNVLAQTTAYIQIEDIKKLYERWTVGENPSIPPTNIASLATDYPTNTMQAPFGYPMPQNTTTPYILFVHGWNMNSYEKDRFAECAFKRLYWQGYHGRFGEFRWPTDFDFNGTLIDAILQPHNFDGSENQAWNSAAGLLNKLNDLNAEYPGQVYLLAHSMGNVVAGEALRLAAQQGLGQIVNTYVASQAAIPAHVYDGTVTAPYLINYNYYAHADPAPGHPLTPNIYVNRLTNNIASVGKRISRYNVNDYALNADAWCFDQEHKPDTYVTGTYNYSGTTNDPAPWNNFYWEPFGGSPVFLDIVNSLTSRYTVLAFAANPYSTALGATATVTTLTKNVNMTSPANSIWPSPDPLGKSYSSHFWHSAQFRGDFPWEWGYWNTLLFSSQSGFGIVNP